MRTKTLLIAAAALAGGIMVSSADTYSQNIVGYVSIIYSNQYVNVSAPLDSGGTLTNLFVNVYDPTLQQGPYDGDVVNVWNTGTHKYDVYTLDQAQPSGVGDANDINAITPAPTLNPGTLIYLYNNNGKTTNTVAGIVHVDQPVTGAVGITTNWLYPGANFVSSKIPVTGGISSVLQLNNYILVSGPNAGLGVLDGSLIEIPKINAAGQFLGYNVISIDSAQPTGFGDANDINSVPEPVIPIGTGIIIDNEAGNGAYPWVQSF